MRLSIVVKVAPGRHRRRYDSGVSDISDPDRAGRRDRKHAQKLIDAAYAAGRLTSADRASRTQRVESAHTKGDLAMIVRDLGIAAGTAAAAGPTPPPAPSASPGTVSLGSAIPPDQLKAMSKGGVKGAAMVGVTDSMRTALTGEGVKRARRVFLIVVIGFFLLCGLGFTGIVTSIFIGSNPNGGGDAPVSVNLHTAKGWTQMVDAVSEETGSSRVYDIVVYPEYASVNAIAEEGAQRYVYRGGSFDLLSGPVTPASGDPIDLADVDPELIARLPDETAKKHDMPDYDSAYIIVRTMNNEPAIMVYLQQSGRLSRWSIYDLDGTVIGGTPEPKRLARAVRCRRRRGSRRRSRAHRSAGGSPPSARPCGWSPPGRR